MEATAQSGLVPDVGVDRCRTCRDGILGASEAGGHGSGKAVADLQLGGGIKPEVGVVHGKEPAALRRPAGGEAGDAGTFQNRPGTRCEAAAHGGVTQPGAACEHTCARRIGVLAHVPGGKVDLGQIGIVLEEVGKGSGGRNVHALAVKRAVGGAVEELVAQEAVARKPALQILRCHVVERDDGPYTTIPVVVPGSRDVVVVNGPIDLGNRKMCVRDGGGPGKLRRGLGDDLVLGRGIRADGQDAGSGVELPPGVVVLEAPGKLSCRPGVGDKASGQVSPLHPIDRSRLGGRIAGCQVGTRAKPAAVSVPGPILGLAGVVVAIDEGIAKTRVLQDGVLSQAKLGQALAALKEGQVEGRGGGHVPIVQVEGGQAVVTREGLGEVDHLAGVPGGHRRQGL